MCPRGRKPARAGTCRAPVRGGCTPRRAAGPTPPSLWPPHPPPLAQAPREEAHCHGCSAAMPLWPLINPASGPRAGVGTFLHPPAPAHPRAGQPVVPSPGQRLGSICARSQLPSASSPPRGQTLLAPGLEEQVPQRNQVFSLICPRGEHRASPASPCLPRRLSGTTATATARLTHSLCLPKGEIQVCTADLPPFFGLSPVQAASSP